MAKAFGHSATIATCELPQRLTEALRREACAQCNDFTAPLGREQFGERLASMGGVVLEQKVKAIDAMPDDGMRFLIISHLRNAKTMLGISGAAVPVELCAGTGAAD